ncbi:MAG TPA: hypothetical protein VNP20_02900 [Nocardioidaceae bacterium]|nr:hypothetical protein [Nocardioidaceae bacterium]
MGTAGGREEVAAEMPDAVSPVRRRVTAGRGFTGHVMHERAH